MNDAQNESLRAWHFYRKRIFDPTSWHRLLSGKTALGLTGALRQIITKIFAPALSAKSPPLINQTPRLHGGYGHPAKEDLSADLSSIVAASRKLALFISESDPGHFLLMHKARRKATRLINEGHLQCHFIARADHTFSSESARQAFIQSLTNYLQSRYGGRLG